MLTSLADPQVIAAAILAIPATAAAILSYIGNRRGKETVGIAKSNSRQLSAVTNGLMDEKIKRAVTEVLEEKGHQVTEAFITDVLGKILDKHLEEGT